MLSLGYIIYFSYYKITFLVIKTKSLTETILLIPDETERYSGFL